MFLPHRLCQSPFVPCASGDTQILALSAQPSHFVLRRALKFQPSLRSVKFGGALIRGGLKHFFPNLSNYLFYFLTQIYQKLVQIQRLRILKSKKGDQYETFKTFINHSFGWQLDSSSF
jgi:hypothetical protein